MIPCQQQYVHDNLSKKQKCSCMKLSRIDLLLDEIYVGVYGRLKVKNELSMKI